MYFVGYFVIKTFFFIWNISVGSLQNKLPIFQTVGGCIMNKGDTNDLMLILLVVEASVTLRSKGIDTIRT